MSPLAYRKNSTNRPNKLRGRGWFGPMRPRFQKFANVVLATYQKNQESKKTYVTLRDPIWPNWWYFIVLFTNRKETFKIREIACISILSGRHHPVCHYNLVWCHFFRKLRKKDQLFWSNLATPGMLPPTPKSTQAYLVSSLLNDFFWVHVYPLENWPSNGLSPFSIDILLQRVHFPLPC